MYHLTAANVVGARFAPDALGGAEVALVGFCPPAALLAEAQVPVPATLQHFIHVAPASVATLAWGGRRVLCLSHIYGGPVASATVEELAYYGVKTILAYGLVGGLGTAACGMGDTVLVGDAFAADGTTPHYTRAPLVGADPGLRRDVERLWRQARPAPLRPVRAATGDAIYREDEALCGSFRARGCDVVNLDSAPLYAVAAAHGLRAVQCSVVSDVVPAGGVGASTALGNMLGGPEGDAFRPMERVDEVVRFYLEAVLPGLGASA